MKKTLLHLCYCLLILCSTQTQTNAQCGNAILELSDLDGTNGFTLNGIDANDDSGYSVNSAGDINGDGIDDIIIGAIGGDPNGGSSGETYIVFGNSLGFPATFELSSLDGSNGFVLNGINAIDFSGWSVSGAGDINGDGIDDIIIGAQLGDPNGGASGETCIVFGNSLGFPATFELNTLDGTNGFTLNGINANDASGYSVNGAGDVNGDGIDDIIIGAYGADPNGGASGETYVVFGNTTGFPATFELSNLDGTNGFTLNGIDSGDNSGYSVSSAGDINGDGIDDIIIGAYEADSGETYVVFGNTTGFPATFELSNLDGTNGFTLNGIDSEDHSGFSVSGAGDINGDGIDDVIIGARYADPNGPFTNSGETYIVFGNSLGFPATFELSSLDGTNGFTLNGINNQDFSGSSVSGAGDVNGDGIDDIIIGAYPGNANNNAGETYIIFGNSTGFSATFELSNLDGTNGFTLNGINANDASGWSVSNVGDINGDGIDDIIIGAPYAEPNGFNIGQSYIIYGQCCPENQVVYYQDADNDGFGNSAVSLSVCNQPEGFVTNADDCDDTNASIGTVGTTCDDGDACTENDTVQADCSCAGTPIDADNDGTICADDCDDNDASIGALGSACDDSDACTVNDIIQADCTCAGTFADADNDGTCDAEDICTGTPEPNTPCDDGDICTIDDVIQADCSCAGTFADADGDSICDAEDDCFGTYDICGVCAGTGETTWYEDADADGLGNPDVSVSSCEQPDGFVVNSDDDNDNEPICQQNINLAPGWNLISFDLSPTDPAISAVFGGLQADNLNFVSGFEQGTITYDPTVPPFLNTLSTVVDGSAYWVRVQNADILSVSGTCLDNTYRKTLTNGWNLVAFIPDASEAPTSYFSDLISNGDLEYVTGFNNGTLTFDPNNPPFLNTLQQMENGFGYWLKVVNQ